MSDPKASGGGFTNRFIPGLVIGIIAGGVASAALLPMLDRWGMSAGPGPLPAVKKDGPRDTVPGSTPQEPPKQATPEETKPAAPTPEPAPPAPPKPEEKPAPTEPANPTAPK
jgi:hypothetical protein